MRLGRMKAPEWTERESSGRDQVPVPILILRLLLVLPGTRHWVVSG